MKPALLLCGFLLIGVSASAQTPTLNPLPNTVFVGADGKFETAPDTALIQFNITAQADNSKAAYEQASKSAESTRQVLRTNGIDPKSAEMDSSPSIPCMTGKIRNTK